jgi:hypothetical protein
MGTAMKMPTLSLTVALLATSALAQPRPNTLALTCAQVNQLIYSQGAVVFTTGPNTYERHVSNANACERTDYLERAWVRSADVVHCWAGYWCHQETY